METLPDDKREAIADCLDRILKSGVFTSSERLSSFLAYIVKEALAGRGDKLKGYTIALSVFGFNDRFDPQTNSIVRVEATRLRKRLAEYYEGPGAADPLEIRVNRGTYVPEFIDRHPAAAPAATASAAPSPPPPADQAAPEPVPEREPASPLPARGRAGQIAATLAILALLGGGLSLFFFQRSSDAPGRIAANPAVQPAAATSNPPVVTVTRIGTGPRAAIAIPDLQALSREIASALSRFDNLTVLDGSDIAPAPEQTEQSEYRLIGNVGRSGEGLEASFRLLFGAQNEVVWSRRYSVAGDALDPKGRLNIVASVASTLARTSGVIFSDRFRRMPPPDDRTLGFACLMQCAKYYEAPAEPLFLTSRRCLERTIAAEPRNPNAPATLALLTVDGFLRNYSGVEQGQALAGAALLAHDAIALAPHSAQAHLALFMARFFDRRFEDAFVSARRALEANPYSVEIRGRVASAHIIRGQFAEGTPLLREVAEIVDHGPAWLEFYYFLPAYANGDMDAARRYATRVRTAKTPLGVLARIVVAQQDKDRAEIQKWTAYLRAKFPRFADDVPGALRRLALAEPIRDKLLADLAEAGALPRGN